MSLHEDEAAPSAAGDDSVAGDDAASRSSFRDEAETSGNHAAGAGHPTVGGDAAAHGHAEEGDCDEQQGGNLDVGGVHEITDEVFEELVLDQSIVQEVQNVWTTFQRAAESREAAGEAIYAALFDSAPSLQSLFKTPRAVMAMRFMNGLNQIVQVLGEPAKLKVVTETLGFQHMDLEVTIPRVAIFRDAILDLFQVELGPRFTGLAQRGWASMLNYVGGAYIYVRVKYTDRIRLLGASWRVANGKKALASEDEDDEEGAVEGSGMVEEVQEEEQHNEDPGDGKGDKMQMLGAHQVPTTYNDMFIFNAAVMGFSKSTWMSEVLSSFDTIVRNVANTYRLQEECDILSLRLAKYKNGVELHNYKAVMLASLRSLCRDWSPDHEVSWSWLWENVERMIKAHVGKLAGLERALDKLWSGFEDADQARLRTELFTTFFEVSPAGQDYFKQSTTRLHFIADGVVSRTLALYKKPQETVEELSGLGLRHVGYAIPTEMFGPFTTAAIQVVRGLAEDDAAVDAFRWSVNLISRILCRVITEGSTVVMRAINANNGKQLRKAVMCAPRGKRAMWMLSVQVGTQSISPLVWAIETGGLDAAKAIIQDLLTIRADRDRYYYGMGTLFERHPDIIRRLCNDAPALLPDLLDGLVWRSRLTENGYRRVNYYIKHLLMDEDGKFAQNLEWLVANGDPRLICHPICIQVTDITWGRLAFRVFLFGKSWLLFTLVVFVFSQAIIKNLSDEASTTQAQRSATFACRCFIYSASLGQWIYHHVQNAYKDIRSKRFFRFAGRIPLPSYLMKWQDCASLALTFFLIFMFAIEPILTCIPHAHEDFVGSGLFTQVCPQATGSRFVYSLFSMCAMMMYFSLLTDLSVFSTRISALVLVIIRVISEVGLFLFALGFLLLAFACAASTLEHGNKDFSGIPMSALSLLKVTLGMFSGNNYEVLREDEALFASVFAYVIVTVIFLINLLTAQLTSEYKATYKDMMGYARLNRGKIVMECMRSVAKRRWERVIGSLKLDEPCEFGEGDVGLPGGIQVLEVASLNPTTVDMIRRFGGSTSVKARWPADQVDAADEDRFTRVEKLIDKAMRRMTKRSKGGKGGKSGSGAGGSSSQDLSGSGGSSVASQSEAGSE